MTIPSLFGTWFVCHIAHSLEVSLTLVISIDAQHRYSIFFILLHTRSLFVH
jgi:hypothetical protein